MGRDYLGEVKAGLATLLLRAVRSAVAAGALPEEVFDEGRQLDEGAFPDEREALPPLPPFAVEVPKEKGRGDFATNLAFVLAGRVRRSPRQVAEALVEALARELPGGGVDGAEGAGGPGGSPAGAAGSLWAAGPANMVAGAEVAGPGFINFRLSDGWLGPVIPIILEAGADYGRTASGRGRRVLLEFVSANPTGPLNVVNARAAAFGDSLARVLSMAGYDVSREYYVNDAGTQFEKLGLAMEARCRQLIGQNVPLPEGAYPGEYVVELARAYLGGPGGERAREVLSSVMEAGGEAPRLSELRRELARFAVEEILAGQRETLARYGVEYDTWYRESDVRANGGPERVLALLGSKGFTYEQDGAVWFRSTAFGDDQDRVLVRRTGEYTYFLADVAYHLTKFERGFEMLIDIWGQDHHGYVPRMRAAIQALGYPAGSLEILLNQMVRLVRGGEAVKMSKRAGEFVTMEEFLGDVGRDAARFMFLMRSIDSHMDFDIDLARLQASENPVYYVQYAHARICSILRQAEEAGAAAEGVPPGGALEELGRLLTHAAERDLLLKIASFPGEVADAASRREPHRLTVYAQELATLFHGFYTQCRVLGTDPSLTAARLALVRAVRQVLANTLSLLGVSAPERM